MALEQRIVTAPGNSSMHAGHTLHAQVDSRSQLEHSAFGHVVTFSSSKELNKKTQCMLKNVWEGPCL